MSLGNSLSSQCAKFWSPTDYSQLAAAIMANSTTPWYCGTGIFSDIASKIASMAHAIIGGSSQDCPPSLESLRRMDYVHLTFDETNPKTSAQETFSEILDVLKDLFRQGYYSYDFTKGVSDEYEILRPKYDEFFDESALLKILKNNPVIREGKVEIDQTYSDQRKNELTIKPIADELNMVEFLLRNPVTSLDDLPGTEKAKSRIYSILSLVYELKKNPQLASTIREHLKGNEHPFQNKFKKDVVLFSSLEKCTVLRLLELATNGKSADL